MKVAAADGPGREPRERPEKASHRGRPGLHPGHLGRRTGARRRSIPAEPIAWGRCIVVGDVAWMLPANEHHATRWEVRLTPGRNPKWIDLVTDGCSNYVSEQVPGVVTPGVYRVAADGRRSRYRPAGQAPPGRIRDRRPSRCRPLPPAEVLPAAAPTDARRELEGRWTVTRQAYPYDDRSAMVDRPVGTVEITSGYLFVQRPLSGVSTSSGRRPSTPSTPRRTRSGSTSSSPTRSTQTRPDTGCTS